MKLFELMYEHPFATSVFIVLTGALIHDIVVAFRH